MPRTRTAIPVRSIPTENSNVRQRQDEIHYNGRSGSMKTIVIVAVLSLSTIVNASESMFAGYDNFCGLPVFVERTSQGSLADIRQGQRVIIVDPGVMGNWTLSRIFYLAHECAHHKLGHMEMDEQLKRKYMNATRRQELEADCWAAEALGDNGYKADIERTILQHKSEGPIMQGPYPSGDGESSVHCPVCRN